MLDIDKSGKVTESDRAGVSLDSWLDNTLIGTLYLRKQISNQTLQKFGTYSTETLPVHGCTLDSRDLAPGDATEWVVAINKPDKAPGVYVFNFPPNKFPVYAIAVF